MSKTVIIKLTKAGIRSGPFDIYDQLSNLLYSGVSASELMRGYSCIVPDGVTKIKLVDTSKCGSIKMKSLGVIYPRDIIAKNFVYSSASCLWRHLTNPRLFNSFYGATEPYIIEYPFSAQFQDEILQNVQDFSKVFEYTSDNTIDRIEVDDKWFNKAILYNNQQSTGVLELTPKPKNNLKLYSTYPIYKESSKEILYTKSDNFYQFNTFWNTAISSRVPMFSTTCESLSIDKQINQSNMDYSYRSYRKQPLRAKDLKIRYILDSTNNVHIVSQILSVNNQISYK